jgi:hypothetical protein
VTLREWKARPPVRQKGHEHDSLVQDAVLLDVMQQHRGRAVRDR